MFFKFKSKELTKEDYKKMSDSKIGRLMSTDIKAKYEYIRRNFENLKDRNQVLDMLNEVVANEIIDGYYYLGKIYYYEQFGEPDYDKAMSYSKQGVEKGDKDCYLQVAYIAYTYLQDNDTALLYAKEGYAKGDKECWKIIISIYEENNDNENVLYWYNKCANDEIAAVQQYLADAYHDGDYGLEVDYEKAYYWHNKAAKQGHIYSQFHVACMIFEGKGCEQNIEIGLKGMKDLSDKYDYANMYLGDLFAMYGKGVDKDFILGMKYYKKLFNNKYWSRNAYIQAILALDMKAGWMELKYLDIAHDFDIKEDAKRLYNKALDLCAAALNCDYEGSIQDEEIIKIMNDTKESLSDL